MHVFFKSLKISLRISIITLGLMPIGNTMQSQLYNYNNDIRPTLEQYCTYKNVLPITFNTNDNTKAVFNFLKEYQPQDRELLEELLSKIYNFANYLSCNSYTHWGSFYDVVRSYWETADCWGRYAFRDYNNVSPIEPNDNTKTNLLKTVKIDLQSINEIISRIQCLQNQINPKRYKNTNSIPNYRNSNIMELFYYISNLWVQTTQDIIYIINKEVNNYNGDRIKIKSKIIQPCYDVLNFTVQELKHLFTNNVFLLHNIDNNEHSKKFHNKVQNRLNHLLKQNDLTLHLEDFKKDYLDKYSVNTAYYNSLLKKNIFEKEKQIIDKIEKYREKFKQGTNERESDQNTIKEHKNTKKSFENYLFEAIRIELNSPHFKYEKSLKNSIESLQKELNALNNNENLIKDNINTNIISNSDNNINKEEEIFKQYNEKFIKESNEYLKNMWKNINYNTDRFIKYYGKINDNDKEDNEKLAQCKYRQEQLKYYENEIKELKDFIKQELTINHNNNKIPNINYSENIKQLLKEYTE